jgi:hypothetical protein
MRRTHLCLDGDKEEVETLPMIVQVHIKKADTDVEYYAAFEWWAIFLAISGDACNT